MTLLFENDELEKLIQKYHLMVYSGLSNDYYLCFEGDKASSYRNV